MKRIPHPNATLGATGATGGGAFVVWLAHLAGWPIDPYVALLIAGAITWLILGVGRIGMRGVWHGLLDGFTPKAPQGSAAAKARPQ